MKFTIGWLKDHLDFSCSIEELCEKLTSIGLEVENLKNPTEQLKDFVIAKVTKVIKHPNADKLKLCDVTDGKDIFQIVCGAPNVKEGLITVLAKEGTKIFPSTDKQFKISKSKIRGVESNGMLCSEEELGLEVTSDGIIELCGKYKIGCFFSKYVNDEDIEIEIAITPNRVDCAGVYGIARDLSASGLGKLKKKTFTTFKTKNKSNLAIDNQLKHKDCPYFYARQISNVNNGDSPVWMTKRFNKTGIKCISSLVDITNYINIDYCRPLHVFDYDKIEGNLIIRYSKKGEIFLGLDDQNYTLEDGMIVICDEKKIISLAGVLGGKNSCCDENTKNIVIESAYFLPDSIASTGRKLNIQSDARYRFERGIDPFSTEDGINYATEMILDICGGDINEQVTDNGKVEKLKEIEISTHFVNQLLGTTLDEKIINDILSKIGCLVKKNDSSFFVTVPSWRQDISLKEDLVEEVARLYGYNRIKNDPLKLTNNKLEVTNNNQKLKKKLKENLVSRNITEIINWSFSNEKWELFLNNKHPIQIENPISSDLCVLRSNLVAGLFDVIKKNYNRGNKNLSIFELGPVFSEEDEEIKQFDQIVVMRSGNMVEKNWIEKNRKFDVFDVKSDLIATLQILGLNLKGVSFCNEKKNYYHPGKSCLVKFGNCIIGSFGEIHPSLKRNFDLKNDVCMFEINYSKITPFLKVKNDSRKEYVKTSFQSSIRDFSFNINKKMPSGEMINFIKNIDEELIQGVKIFDNYDDEKTGRSVGVEVTIQSKLKTLSELEINKLADEIVEKVQKKYDIKLR